MFQNAYQSGPSVEIFDPKINKEKEKSYINLFKVVNNNLIKKIFDKSMKGYIYELDAGVNSKIIFPKDERADLALLQQYLVFQIFLPQSQMAFGIDLIMTDTSKTKRRVNLTTAVNKIDLNFFHVKIPIEIIKRGVWLNLAIDVLSFMDAFKNQTFRSLDGIVINAVCKLRKIFTMRYPPYIFKSDDDDTVELRDLPNAQEIPKNLNFPAGIPYTNQLITYDLIKLLSLDSHPPLTENLINQTFPKQIAFPGNKYQNKPNTSGTPVKEPFPASQKKTTPIKAPPPPPPPPQEEEIKEESNIIIENEEESKNKEIIESSGVFQPMGKAATGISNVNKKNPWSSQNSKKSIVQKPQSVVKPKEDLQINGAKVNKRLDLDTLKKKGTNKKNPSVENIRKPIQKSPEKDKSPENRDQEDYYEKSSKFNTVTDPRIFAPENLALNKWSNEEISGENNEIEENIKEIESMRASKKFSKDGPKDQIKDPKASNFKSPTKRDPETKANQDTGNSEENNQEEGKTIESPAFKETSKGNFYEEELNKMLMEGNRPYSPPFHNPSNQNVEMKKMEEKGTGASAQKNMLEVVYDPVLNCYYDPKTNSYYDLIN